MAIRKRIQWTGPDSLADPRLEDFVELIRAFRQLCWVQRGWKSEIFQNREEELPLKAAGYYREFKPGVNAGLLRIVLGNGREIYLSGDHYGDYGVGFRQIIGVPD